MEGQMVFRIRGTLTEEDRAAPGPAEAGLCLEEARNAPAKAGVPQDAPKRRVGILGDGCAVLDLGGAPCGNPGAAVSWRTAYGFITAGAAALWL